MPEAPKILDKPFAECRPFGKKKGVSKELFAECLLSKLGKIV